MNKKTFTQNKKTNINQEIFSPNQFGKNDKDDR